MSPAKTSDPGLYRAYRAGIESDRLIRSLRAGCFVVAILSTAFIPLDYAVFHDRFGPMLGFRVFCNAVMAVIIFWGARTHPLPSAIVGSLTTGAMLLMVIFAAGGVTSDYTPGLMLLFLGMPVLLPFTAVQAGFIVAVLTAGLAALPAMGGAAITLEAYSLHMIFPIAAGIESVAASAMLDKLRFADFIRTKEIERARDDLKELDRERSRFTSNIHHELRTPLTLMLAPVDGLLDGSFGEIADLPRSYLRSIQANGQRLLRLINNLLDLAKVEGRKYAICRRQVSVRRLVEEYVASAIPLAEQKGVALESRWHEPECKIFADAEAVEKVVGNLLGNALKFTPAGGEISIQGTNDSDGGVHFVVRDTGVGIPEGKLDTIFDRFAQVDSTVTRRFEGTGIGLSLVKELVSLHGGRVWAESEGAGLGAEIHVALPVGKADERLENLVVECDASGDLDDDFAGVERVQGLGVALGDRDLSIAEIRRNLERADLSSPLDDRPILERPQGTQTVLVVEDNRDMRRLLSHFLSEEFFVETAANGREGLDAARRIRPDLVLTDVMMPEMSGTDLCEALKSDPAMRTTPVVLVTSKADREMKIKGLELGADDYVTKPFHPKELIARVRSLLRVSSLQREVSVKNARLESVNEELSQTLIDLKDAESALVQAERLAAVGELAAGIAHEVNNPVNFATNALRTLRVYVGEINEIASRIGKLDVSDFDRVRSQIVELDAAMKEAEFADVVDSLDELVGIVTEGLGRTARLVDDLQRFGSPANDDVGAVDLGACIRSTIELVRYSARDRGVMLHSDVDSGLPHIHGSAQSLSQVLLNLVKNAIEAVSVRRGNVWVRAKEIDGSVVVEVSDDGPGVAVGIVDQLFDPFVTTKPAGDGTGLGLAISRRVVSDHNGEIRVSRSLVGGARFEVLFPIFPVTVREENAAEA